jgi:caffeoyl-CoA O-methyltransferase
VDDDRAPDVAGGGGRVARRAPAAVESLDALLDSDAAGSFDFAFVDAAKDEYPAYYERVFELLRRGGLVAFDNVFLNGAVSDPDAISRPRVEAVRQLNETLARDERVSIAMVPIADGMTLVRKR